MVPGWVGWSPQQLLMDCMQKGAEAEDLEPEPVWEAGKRGGGKQGGCWTPDSEEWAWESVFIMSRPPGDSGETELKFQLWRLSSKCVKNIA